MEAEYKRVNNGTVWTGRIRDDIKNLEIRDREM